ncbi:hypothetical protein [Marinobacter sp.]|uniref:hypothetical protein n=1 Tax=Marinobacter sp. TaxID=50741 RepID=UPI003A95B3F5
MSQNIDGQLGSLVDALKELLGKWADHNGVTVKYHRTEPVLMLSLRTPDDLAIEVTYHINHTSKAYIDNMVQGIREHLFNERQARHHNPIIVNTRRSLNA